MTAQRESSWYNRRSTKYNYHTMTMAHASALITRLDDAAGSAIPRTSGCPSRRSDHTAVCWTKGINDRAINESKRMTSTREMAAFHGSLLYSTIYRVNICAETHRFDEPRPWKGSPYRLLTALRRPLEIYTHVYIYIYTLQETWFIEVARRQRLIWRTSWNKSFDNCTGYCVSHRLQRIFNISSKSLFWLISE